jgi:hypothetical protein
MGDLGLISRRAFTEHLAGGNLDDRRRCRPASGRSIRYRLIGGACDESVRHREGPITSGERAPPSGRNEHRPGIDAKTGRTDGGITSIWCGRWSIRSKATWGFTNGESGGSGGSDSSPSCCAVTFHNYAYRLCMRCVFFPAAARIRTSRVTRVTSTQLDQKEWAAWATNPCHSRPSSRTTWTDFSPNPPTPACPIDPWRSSMVIRRPSENRESGHAPSRGPLIRSVPNETTPPRSPDPDGAAWFPGVVVEPDSSAIPAVPANRHSEPD